MTMLVPKIIYGTAWKEERTACLVVNAVLTGFRAIDTASQRKHYREDFVGQALLTLRDKHHVKREDLFLQSKYTSIQGHDTNKLLPYDPSTPIAQQVCTSMETSLAQLHTAYLDSYVLHSPLPTLNLTLEAWRTLASLQEQGKVHAIGVSNTDVSTLRAIHEEHKVDVVQNRWYERNGWDKSVYHYCIANGIQYQSFWTLTGSPSLLAHPELQNIARAAGCTPQQAVFKIAQMRGITPLVGTTNEKHMREALAVEQLKIDPESSSVRTIMKLLGT